MAGSKLTLKGSIVIDATLEALFVYMCHLTRSIEVFGRS